MKKLLKNTLLAVLLLLSVDAFAQKLIQYEAGMGTRDPFNSDVWILYQRVRAEHDGMILYADSALLNTKKNDFTAYYRIKILVSDTTTIYGDELFYDGNTRVLNIWGDTVILIDGKTTLKTTHLSYDRNTSIATYTTWGHATNEDKILDSRMGQYNSDTKEFFIHNEVVLQDSTSRLESDTLYYNTETKIATFVSPTHIYSDSSTIYSERGTYNTDTRYALSLKASQVYSDNKTLTCDTLHYYERPGDGKAIGHVYIFDSVNDLTCTGKYGETSRERHYSLITDSALAVFVDKGDSLFLHADTIYATTDSVDELSTVRAFRHVKAYRKDVQGMCDSVFYSVQDSISQMFGSPVVWQNHYQCTSDTIVVHFDTAGPKKAFLDGGTFAIEQVDPSKFNQVKGKHSIVYFVEGEPDYADILGNAEMVYYITEEDSAGHSYLIGVNAGVGSDMRVYFENREPKRMVTFGHPDMHTYPIELLPSDKKQLQGFVWLSERRPRNRHDVFKW